MFEMKNSTKVLILVSFAVYIGHLALNGLAAQGGPGNKLFPHSVSNISERFQLEMTPSGPTFAIWGAIFLLQLAWLVYALTTICRSVPSADILSNTFYVAFNLNIVCISAWLLVWCRAESILAFIANLLAQVFIYGAIGLSFRDLKKFLDSNKGYKDGNADVWTQRLLIQNALEFYATWTTVALSICFAIVLSYDLGLSTRVASVISLSIVAIVACLWFIVENSVLLKYTEYTFSVYVVLIIASSGIVSNIFATDKVVGGIALALLIGSALMLIIRLIVIIVRHVKKSQGNYLVLSEI